MTPGTYNIPTHRRGDTTAAVTFTFERGDPLEPIDLTGAAINIKFRDRQTKKVALSLIVGSGVTVTDAVNGVARINKGAMTPLEFGVYDYDVELIESNGDKNTYLAGTKSVQIDTTH